MSQDKGWIGYDLDATVAFYDGYQGATKIGAPIRSMVERIKADIAAGEEVRIVTARVSMPEGLPATERLVREEQVKQARQAIHQWCNIYIGHPLRVTCSKDFRMRFCYDDRVKQVVPNTGLLVEDLLETALARLRELEARLERDKGA